MLRYASPARRDHDPGDDDRHAGELRKRLDLYAKIRPAKSRGGFPPRCGSPVDLVIAREIAREMVELDLRRKGEVDFYTPERDLPGGYRSQCDPRLNPGQAVELAECVAAELARERGAEAA